MKIIYLMKKINVGFIKIKNQINLIQKKHI